MSFLSTLSRGLDSAVAAVSPTWGVKRQSARELLDRQRQYAAAKARLPMGGPIPYDQKVNTVIGSSVRVMRARARQLVRDMPAMATAVGRLAEFTVGDGLILQARVKDPSTGKLAKELNQKIEDCWKFWCEDADMGGRLCFEEIQQLCARQETEVGEYIGIKYLTQGQSYLPFRLMLVEPDQLCGYGATPLPGNEVFEGVEYDPRTGRAQAYHFEDATRWKSVLRIPADQVLCGYQTLRPGQLRGVTPLAPAILLANSLSDFIDNELLSAQMAARYLAFVTSPDPSETMKAFGAALTPEASTHPEKYTMEMGGAIVDFLKTGESVTLANHNRPGDAFSPFTQWAVQTFAATVGVTYELLSGNYTEAAYTGARLGRNDMLAGLRVRRGRLKRQLLERSRREFMNWAVLTGKLDLPQYFSNPAPYLRCVWIDPGADALDPLREGRAEGEAVDKILRSPQEVMLGRGRDPETVLDERKEWEEMLAERGLSAVDPKTGLKTNPAAVAPGTGSGAGRGDEDFDGDGVALLRRIK